MADLAQDKRTERAQASILLVDDEPANLLALEAILADLGQPLVKAHSGEDALRLLLERDYAVILLDVQMQGMDGFEAAQLIRNRQRSRHTPIIFLTAYESNRLPVEQAYALGAVDYLTKPLVPTILRAKVAGFVELFEKSEQIKRQAEQIRQMERREFERRLAEENDRLRAQQEHLRAIVDTALDCIITMDGAGKIVEFNPAAERTFGQRRDAVLGKDLAELIIPPALRPQHNGGLAHCLATGAGPILGRRMEMPALRADGSEFPVELAIHRIPGAAAPLFTAYLRDITERKRAEARRNARLAVTQVLAAEPASVLEAAPRLLQAIGEGLGWDVAAFWTTDQAAKVLRCRAVWHPADVQAVHFIANTWNRTFAMGVGLPGRVWSSGTPAWVRDVAHDGNFPRGPFAAQDGLHGALACPVSLGSECLGVMEFFSRELREPDADLLEMMASIGGQIGQFMERRRAEEVQRESERRFARFMQHLPGLAWIKDRHGRYLYANDAAEKAFGATRDRLYGRTDDEVFPPAIAAQFRANDLRAVASEAGVQAIESLPQDDGVHHSIVSKFPILGPDGQVAMVGGIAIDITDRMKMEEALKEADRRKDEFLATLAHELRNPLAPIRNALHIMKPTADPHMREMAERQVQHMARLLDDLLDVSRISRGRIELRKEVVEVVPLVVRTIEAVRPMIEDRRHALTMAFPPDAVHVRADPTRLEQVLSNLLNNSCKYTDPGGEIAVVVQQRNGQVHLMVRDNGIGIAPEMLPRIFDLFVQAERRLDRSQGGVGIGLTLVRQLVELHGGTVEARSRGPGQGSEFVVCLPVVQESVAEAVTPGQAPEAPAAPPARRVLVVDDNQDAAESLAMLLQMVGQEVRVAFDGPHALSVAQEFQPQFVFLDLGMPGMDGYEVARHLRGFPGFQKVVLAALTGWGQEEDRQRSRQAGFDLHLVKPVDPNTIQKLLAQFAPAK